MKLFYKILIPLCVLLAVASFGMWPVTAGDEGEDPHKTADPDPFRRVPPTHTPTPTPILTPTESIEVPTETEEPIEIPTEPELPPTEVQTEATAETVPIPTAEEIPEEEEPLVP